MVLFMQSRGMLRGDVWMLRQHDNVLQPFHHIINQTMLQQAHTLPQQGLQRSHSTDYSSSSVRLDQRKN